MVTSNITMKKKSDLLYFDHGMVVGISIVADLLGFSRTTIFRIYTKWCEKTPVYGRSAG